MASTPQPAPLTPTDKGMSEISRIIGVFFDPKKSFADIAARPRFWVPLILGIIIGITTVTAISKRIGWEPVVRHAIETNSRTQNLPAEQREQIIQQQVKFTSIGATVGGVVGGPVMMLVIAAVLLFIFKLLLDTPLNFRQVFAVTCYAFLTGIVSSGLMILVMFLKSPEDFDLQNPLAFNIGAFLGQTAPAWLMSLGKSIDVFSFWTMALLATGLAACSKRMPWSRAFMGVLIPWALLVVLKVGWAAIFS